MPKQESCRSKRIGSSLASGFLCSHTWIREHFPFPVLNQLPGEVQNASSLSKYSISKRGAFAEIQQRLPFLNLSHRQALWEEAIQTAYQPRPLRYSRLIWMASIGVRPMD